MRRLNAPALPALLVLLALLALLSAANAGALGPRKPWFGGVYAGFCGFSEPTDLPAAAYLEAGVFVEPFAARFLNPALSCGLLLPVSPPEPEGLRLQLGAELSLLDLPAPLIKRRFYSSGAFSPAVGGEYLLHPGTGAQSFAVVFSPLRFRVADAVFSLGSLRLFLGERGRPAGWGLTLFRAALFVL